MLYSVTAQSGIQNEPNVHDVPTPRDFLVENLAINSPPAPREGSAQPGEGPETAT